MTVELAADAFAAQQHKQHQQDAAAAAVLAWKRALVAEARGVVLVSLRVVDCTAAIAQGSPQYRLLAAAVEALALAAAHLQQAAAADPQQQQQPVGAGRGHNAAGGRGGTRRVMVAAGAVSFAAEAIVKHAREQLAALPTDSDSLDFATAARLVP